MAVLSKRSLIVRDKIEHLVASQGHLLDYTSDASGVQGFSPRNPDGGLMVGSLMAHLFAKAISESCDGPFRLRLYSIIVPADDLNAARNIGEMISQHGFAQISGPEGQHVVLRPIESGPEDNTKIIALLGEIHDRYSSRAFVNLGAYLEN